MYEIDEHDRVVELTNLPQSSIGAPMPIILADEHAVLVAYCSEIEHPEFDGTNPLSVSENDEGEVIVMVKFLHVLAHYFGMPNDEAFSGHPLAARGLTPYGAFRVENSSWIRRLDRMNSVHPYHSPRFKSGLQHIVLSFHDSTFECVCGEGYAVRTQRGSLRSAERDLLSWLRH